MSASPEVFPFFDEYTFTASFVLKDPASKKIAIIDSVLDFDYASGRTNTQSADEIIAFVKKNAFEVEYLLETHVHADHLSAAPYLQAELGGKIAIGENIKTVQDTFGKVFNAGTEFERDGSQFDVLLQDGDVINLGELDVKIMFTPGHTPACLTYITRGCAFIGDTLFMPDYGTARADFPGGSARDLYRSIQKIFALPDETKLYVGHDYLAPGRQDFRWQTTVGESKASNIHLSAGVSEAEYIAMREARDKTLAMPRLIVPSLQVNMRAGKMPPEEDNGVVYMKVPINVLGRSK